MGNTRMVGQTKRQLTELVGEDCASRLIHEADVWLSLRKPAPSSSKGWRSGAVLREELDDTLKAALKLSAKLRKHDVRWLIATQSPAPGEAVRRGDDPELRAQRLQALTETLDALAATVRRTRKDIAENVKASRPIDPWIRALMREAVQALAEYGFPPSTGPRSLAPQALAHLWTYCALVGDAAQAHKAAAKRGDFDDLPAVNHLKAWPERKAPRGGRKS
jgi:hypothetical protein